MYLHWATTIFYLDSWNCLLTGSLRFYPSPYQVFSIWLLKGSSSKEEVKGLAISLTVKAECTYYLKRPSMTCTLPSTPSFPSSPILPLLTLPQEHCYSHTVFLQGLECTRDTPALGPLTLLFFLPETLLAWLHAWLTPLHHPVFAQRAPSQCVLCSHAFPRLPSPISAIFFYLRF